MSEDQVPAVVTPVEQSAPLVEVVMFNIFGANWKTSLQGYLSFIAYGTGSITAWLSGYIAMHPNTKPAWWAAASSTSLGLASAVAKAWIGRKQMDAEAKQ